MTAKRDFSFGSFLVDDGNRRGHDLCLAVSEAEPISPLPIVLVGEPGTGKTHLLYAIANRLRATAGHAAILFVAPGTWGEEVERIIANPAPIDMARHAVLLVDDLQGFAAKFEQIARLIEIFLENDHYVVLATEAHPDRLAALPAKLRRQLKGGQVVEMSAGDGRRSLEIIEARLREEQADAFAKLEQRVREMEFESPEAAAARRQSRTAELEQARREIAEGREEAEHLRAEMALSKVSARDATQLRARVQELERQLVERAKQPAPVEGKDAIKRKLVEARFDAQKAREEARGMLERAQGLLAELHQSRSAFDEAQLERERQRGEILKLEAVFRGEPPVAEDSASASEASAPIKAPAALEPQAAPAEVAALQDEIHRLQESLVRARSERDTMKSHLAHVREELDETRRDSERMRTESLKERAEREEQVRQAEEALVARHGEVESLREVQKTLTEEVESLRAQVADGAGVVERLMALLGGGAKATPEASSNAADSTPEDAPIVRADFGESLRLAPKRSAGVHHVEELRGAAGPGFPQPLPQLDDTNEGDSFYRGTAKTA